MRRPDLFLSFQTLALCFKFTAFNTSLNVRCTYSKMKEKLINLKAGLSGELFYDNAHRVLYATDASAYRELPIAVAIPRDEEDIKKLILFANDHNVSLIPRAAGTSLAGQVVGSGIVVDISKYMTSIVEFNAEEQWVRVQPGVIRDELNMFLKPYGFFFGPETSTANRAMIGGMVGNNSCGSNSIAYGTTRDHLVEAKGFLSDGSEIVFKSLTNEEFRNKAAFSTLEGSIYKNVQAMLSSEENRAEITKEFPKPVIKRRNTGYALDALMELQPFNEDGEPFNFCRLVAGSEGTLALITEVKLNVLPIPSWESGLLCGHFHSIDDSLRANLIALEYEPTASELIDHYILDCTKENIEQRKNRFFVQGDPHAILVVELTGKDKNEVIAKARACEERMRAEGLGYHFPLLFDEDRKKVWSLRKAGLGLLGNVPGDDKAVPVIEDTAVDVHDLPQYIREFNDILKKYNLDAVHYAHAGSGELHLRPIINLKTQYGNELFRTIAREIAGLVKKYKGSLSGEHGDGRLRGEFIKQMVGAKNYALFEELKNTWDPKGLFNPGKIVDTPPMNTMLRYEPGQKPPELKTTFRFYNQDILQHAEQCNGTGECRKTHHSGGTMCPSYMASKNEKDSTRARANVLREFLTRSSKPNRYDHQEIYEVMDLCLSCKGCKSECPSNVDVAKLKAEFLQHYYEANGVPRRAKLIANFTKMSAKGALVPSLYNFAVSTPPISHLIKSFAGFARPRSMPLMYKTTLRKWYRKRRRAQKHFTGDRKVYLFCDEFTNYNDTEIGIKTIQLLERLGYEVIIPEHKESGRTWLSKGLIKEAKTIARYNVEALAPIISEETPLIGIEPSAILTFRDEYIDLADDDIFEKSKALAANVYYIDEFLAAGFISGSIDNAVFNDAPRHIKLHGHCHQKSLSDFGASVTVLSSLPNTRVEVIPSGCCGMAGSFGYEKEHYELSMQVGELVLFPAVRETAEEVIIAAPGTSCRHQILDGTKRLSQHPVEVLFHALK